MCCSLSSMKLRVDVPSRSEAPNLVIDGAARLETPPVSPCPAGMRSTTPSYLPTSLPFSPRSPVYDRTSSSSLKRKHDTMSCSDYWAAPIGESTEHKCFVRVEFVYGGVFDKSVFRYVDSALTVREIKEKLSMENFSVETVPINLRVHPQGFGGVRMIGAAIFRVSNGDGSRTSDAAKYEKADEKTFKECLAETFSVGRELLDSAEPPYVILHWTTIR